MAPRFCIEWPSQSSSPRSSTLCQLVRAGLVQLRLDHLLGAIPVLRRNLDHSDAQHTRIVEAILTGHQPPELTAKALTERIELPLLWSEQEHAVGIN